MSSQKRSSKPKPISQLIKPLIQEVKKGMNETYRINVTHFSPQRRQRICHALKNALKSNDLDYEVSMKNGIIYLFFEA